MHHHTLGMQAYVSVLLVLGILLPILVTGDVKHNWFFGKFSGIRHMIFDIGPYISGMLMTVAWIIGYLSIAGSVYQSLLTTLLKFDYDHQVVLSLCNLINVLSGPLIVYLEFRMENKALFPESDVLPNASTPPRVIEISAPTNIAEVPRVCLLEFSRCSRTFYGME